MRRRRESAGQRRWFRLDNRRRGRRISLLLLQLGGCSFRLLFLHLGSGLRPRCFSYILGCLSGGRRGARLVSSCLTRCAVPGRSRWLRARLLKIASWSAGLRRGDAELLRTRQLLLRNRRSLVLEVFSERGWRRRWVVYSVRLGLLLIRQQMAGVAAVGVAARVLNAVVVGDAVGRLCWRCLLYGLSTGAHVRVRKRSCWSDRSGCSHTLHCCATRCWSSHAAHATFPCTHTRAVARSVLHMGGHPRAGQAGT